MTANAVSRILQHYVDNFRRLPWRSSPGEPAPDPYRVWLSEVMLQQTTVATVQPRFERFVERWPTIETLAAASDEDILSEWAGLGYYARARNLIACAREVASRGSFPRLASELRELPGIGAYTSAAIAAIAFGEKAAAVDTNVERVMARLNAIKRPSRAEIERLVLDLIPAGRPGDFVQAMMDLGATVCLARIPRCELCPLAAGCPSRGRRYEPLRKQSAFEGSFRQRRAQVLRAVAAGEQPTDGDALVSLERDGLVVLSNGVASLPV